MTTSRNILPPRRRWSDAEIELLRRDFVDRPTSDIAVDLGRSSSQVLSKANSLGLHKSKELIASIARERACTPGHGSEKTRFQKGIVPANKGVKRPGWAPGEMARTQFKKGSKPQTWVPVGSYRIKEGYLERKINDLPGNTSVRWKTVHMLVWVEANGPVPAGHVVVFRPGRHTAELSAITLDAVELVSRAELMARNTIHNLHPKIAEVSRLRGTLKRAINKRTKDQQP